MSEKVQCVDCKSFDLSAHSKDMRGHGSDSAGLGANGFGSCALKSEVRPREFLSATRKRECADFTDADKTVAEKRRAWLDKKARGE